MSKIVVLSFSEDEEKACQRLLQIISDSHHFEGCNVLQMDKWNVWKFIIPWINVVLYLYFCHSLDYLLQADFRRLRRTAAIPDYAKNWYEWK